MAYFTPDIVADKITDINREVLKRYNVKAILMDIDNTLSPHGSYIPYDGVCEWVNDVKSFGIDIMILSNSKNMQRVANFANTIGIDDYILNAKKPFNSGFNRGINMLDVSKEEILIIGDQIFTDVLGANLAKIKSALVKARDKNEPIFIKIKRIFEIPIKALIQYKCKKGRIEKI